MAAPRRRRKKAPTRLRLLETWPGWGLRVDLGDAGELVWLPGESQEVADDDVRARLLEHHGDHLVPES